MKIEFKRPELIFYIHFSRKPSKVLSEKALKFFKRDSSKNPYIPR